MLTSLLVNDPGGCPCYGPGTDGCVCDPSERVLRAYIANRPLSAMTPEQREACLDEIAHVEGYERTDYEASTDQELARGVIDAWVDYCREKGLL